MDFFEFARVLGGVTGFLFISNIETLLGKTQCVCKFTLSQVKRLLLHVAMSLKPVVCWNVTQRPLAAKEARSVTRNKLQLYATLLPSCNFNLASSCLLFTMLIYVC